MITPLRKARDERGESTYVVAAAVGVNQSQYSRVESGKRRPSPDLADRIAKYLGTVTRDQILFPEDYMKAEPEHPTPPGKKKSRGTTPVSGKALSIAAIVEERAPSLRKAS
jgi:transcriptional regulator with XRE-family HTH domain